MSKRFVASGQDKKISRLRGEGRSAGCCGLSVHARAVCKGPLFTRRTFLAAGAAPILPELPRGRISPARRPLRVQPVFIYALRSPRDRTSWRWSAEIYREQDARQECARIEAELRAFTQTADFPLELLPLVKVNSLQQVDRVPPAAYDAAILYASARNPETLEALARPDKWNLVFVRHRSGPLYYMYIGLHGHVLRKRTDHLVSEVLSPDDVVVDAYPELLWRLRALAGLRNTLGKRVLTIGVPGGWGAEGRLAPERARQRWRFEIPTVSYAELEKRLRSAFESRETLSRASREASAYRSRRGVSTEVPADSLTRAFVLLSVFRECLQEAGADALTVAGCMGAIMEISGTTACVALSVLNDEGYVAFCEGDFVSVPAGVLLHSISGRPIFMANGSWPWNGLVLASHCTAPTRMDGANFEPVRLLTHYESDFGAAPKVEMRKGQVVTVLDPDFEGKRYLGFRGEIRDTPSFPACRTQLEISVAGDSRRLAQELRGWHWMLCYGDFLKETGYAVRKAGLDWLAL